MQEVQGAREGAEAQPQGESPAQKPVAKRPKMDEESKVQEVNGKNYCEFICTDIDNLHGVYRYVHLSVISTRRLLNTYIKHY